MKPSIEFTLGVDLAQDSFVACVCVGNPRPERWRDLPTVAIDSPPDSPEGIEALMAWINVVVPKGRCTRVVVESTGKISRRFAKALRGRGLSEVAVVNPCRPKAYGASLGIRDKTDDVDARVQALYAAVNRPQPAAPKSDSEERLRDKTRLRESYIEDLNRWQNRRREAMGEDDRQLIDETIRHIEDAIKRLERASGQTIEQDAVLSRQVQALVKIRGIKTITATTLTAELGDLTRYSRSKLTAAAGLFPKRFDSGTSVHRPPRLAKGGGGRLRRVLYMCATSLFRSKGALRQYIETLQKRGLSDMLIEGAVMRKLLLIARAVAKNGGTYDETKICAQSA